MLDLPMMKNKEFEVCKKKKKNKLIGYSLQVSKVVIKKTHLRITYNKY